MGKGKRVQSKSKLNVKKIGIILAIILGIIFVFHIANNYIILDKNKKFNLVINNKNITANMKNDILIENDVIYISQPDIKNFFDKYIYREDEVNKIITTYEKKVAAIGFDENVITINGSDKNIYAHAIERDGTTYLPVSEMKDVYNIEIEKNDKSKVITMDSLDREQKKAIITKTTVVKSSTKFIAKNVDRAKKGSYVIVVSTDNNYAKIRTENGKVGYIKANKLANEITVREAMQDEKQIEGKVNLVWDYYSQYASAPNRNTENMVGVNVVSPSFFYLDDSGSLKTNIGNSGKAYVDWAHDNGYKVWPIVSNAEAGLQVTSRIMNSYTARQELIEDIVDNCVRYKLDGINVDFENMKQEDKDLYSRFIIELTPRLKEIGMVTSVDVTAPDGGETWSMCFDRNVIGNVADYIIFMAYDEYGASSTTAGTTAGYDWVKISLNKFLTTEEIKPEKIILAIPLYTRLWTTDSDGKITNITVSMKKIDTVIPDGTNRQWDNDLKQNYAEYQDGNNKKQIWIEDIDSLKEKISLIKDNNLAGVGSWQKDFETDDVWDMLKQELN